MGKFKIGFLGAGHIAGKVADTLMKLDGFEIYAVASRDEEKGNEFASKYHANHVYTSYEEMVKDAAIDLVYISTPNHLHKDHAMLALKAGRNVLVEKPFSYNSKTSEEVIKYAQSKKLFCAEALWSIYNPMYSLIKDIMVKKVIGRINHINVNFGYELRKVDRVLSPEMAGGALLDIGIYPLSFVIYLLGNKPTQILSSCAKFTSGVDAQDTIIFLYPESITANIFISAIYGTERNAFIYGDKGYIKVNEISCPTSVEIYSKANELIQRFDTVPGQISGYEYEFASAKEAISRGMVEPLEMPHNATLAIAEHMDKLRQNWKITFPME